ncbi:hypothetical protein DUK53_08825 [Listeria sp. SHR_NRA_18]|uniref:hypothetical protein n=1 Tax=Listeria TaxID=1637 RepID=UPI00051DF7B1|nr:MULTISPECIES: hypothetical protein [Listeria]KGL46069.1 hypothetical protein EP56_03050 [Listeriaceae bacterium FSL A5-0209]KMT58703.1 hypothetical protein X559_2955 [Listeria newyorkensis]RQW66730.1 hypothetical protein DUK53_08825 [Listeria sp. SHR_NRA_18]
MMNFFEFHENILRDDFFEKYLDDKLSKKSKKIITKVYYTDKNKVAIIKSGLFICERQSIILKKGDYIYNQDTELVAIETGEIQEFNVTELVSLLEKEELLSNFYLVLVNQYYKRIHFLKSMVSFSSRDRVKFLLERINVYATNELDVYDIGIRQVARFCNCSLNTVKKAM